jgi:type I restriction enzyme, R subunit
LLVKFLDPESLKYVTTNFEDELYEEQVVVKNPFPDNHVSEKVQTKTIFENSVFRLEQKIRENQSHLTISRIKNREPITRE